MNYKEQFNMPLPKINREVKNINIETSNSISGAIVIKNDGGGEIAGRVMSNSGQVTFDPDEFLGNDSKITYYVNLDYYNPGDVLITNAVIMSNGGEHIIDFNVKVVPPAIETKEGVKISSLKDFYEYCVGNPVTGRQLFVSYEFMMWLYQAGYSYMDIYERFAADANKERALDNFLIFNNLKNRTKVSCYDKNIQIHIYQYYNKIWTDAIRFRKSGWGYVDAEIKLKYDCDWFELSKERLVTADFDDEYEAELNFFINAEKLPAKINVQCVLVGDMEIRINVIRAEYIEVKLEKEYLRYDESSKLIVRNNSGTRLTVDIIPEDTFIKFENVRFLVDELAAIPFSVQLSPLLAAQIGILKQPFMKTCINVESVFDRRAFNKKLNLTIGELT